MYRPLILGLGRSGKAAFRFFVSKGIHPVTYDDCFPTPVHFEEISEVIVSPGFSLDHSKIVEARQKKIPVYSEIDLALKHICAKRIIAVTGSNGKSTFVMQLEHILKTYGYHAKALGNNEIPLSSILDTPLEVAVVELSAQQLETTHEKVLDVAVLLNIQPNHLDRYETMERYKRTKMRIFNLLKPDGLALGPDKEALEIFTEIGKLFSIDRAKILAALNTYQNLPHRLEYLGDFFGKKIYNDSKSTTLSSTLYALQKMQRPVQLIFGGKSKGETLENFLESFSKAPLVRILAIGETMEEIHKIFQPVVEVVRCSTLEIAVKVGLKGDGDLLLSPGFASYDQFNSYAHRGESFKQRIEWEKKMLS
ncbi:MAG: hypothetical protein EB053_00320 [Chlamydiae bacterium]|nr:hypothetical protein [Chlamydiota bacterium]